MTTSAFKMTLKITTQLCSFVSSNDNVPVGAEGLYWVTHFSFFTIWSIVSKAEISKVNKDPTKKTSSLILGNSYSKLNVYNCMVFNVLSHFFKGCLD